MRTTQDESGPNSPAPEPSARREDRYKEFVEFLPQPVFEVDTLGNIVFANRQGLRVFGYDREDLSQGLNALQMLAPEDRERAKKNIERTLRGEDLGGTEYQALKKDGSRFPILIYSTTVNHQGKPSGLRGIVIDISARKKAEEDLKASEERYRQVVELSNDAITIVRGKTHLYVNPKMVAIFGYSQADEIVGRPITLLIHPDDRERVAEFNRRRQEGKAVPSKYEFRGIRRDGETIYLETSATQIRSGQEGLSLVFLRDITDRKQAEAALRESEEILSRAFRATPDWVTITTLEEGRYIEVNDAFLEITGFSRAEVIGRTSLELGLWKDSRDRDRALKHIRDFGNLKDFEVRFLMKSGDERLFVWSAEVIEIKGQQGLLSVCRDITERKKAEVALQESEERYRTILNTVPNSITITRVADGRYLQVNDYFSQITGYSREEAVGKSVFDLRVFIDPEDRSRFIDRMRDQGEVNSFELKYQVKNGKLIDALLSARPLKFAGEDCLVAVVTDITERKTMEEALRKSEEKYRLLVENANEAILVIQEGLIQFANPKAVKIMPYADGDFFPQPFLKFIHPEDREMVLGHYLNRTAGQMTAPVHSSRLLDHQGNILWVEINAVQISWEGQPAVLVFLTDITEKKQLELQFLQAQKMEAVGRLAGGVAHDFNNLLTSILGHSDLMRMRLRPGDPLVGDIVEIVKAANRATDLTRQLLAFSRKQILQPRILNLNGIISDMKKMLMRLIGEDITLETLLSADLGRVLVDPGQIDQVIMNLVVNARDAMPKGGTLTIETGNTLLDEAQVRNYPGARPGAYVLLSVRDSGSGMTEDLQSHIFEPFFTTKELGKGTGLGLSTVYGIVKQSNGYIWVDSQQGLGTEFKIFLPQQEGEAESDLKPERGKVSLRGKETVLLAEDNELVRGLTRSVLEHFGYQVLETEDGEEAGRMSKGYEGPIHLLVTDVVMPGINGRVLAEQLQHSRPGIKILFISGYSEEAALLQGMQKLGAYFLQKPFTPEELGLRVREILDSV